MSRNLLLYKMQTLYLFLPSNTLCVCFFNKQGVFMFLVFLCCLHSFLYGVIKFRGKYLGFILVVVVVVFLPKEGSREKCRPRVHFTAESPLNEEMIGRTGRTILVKVT
jgi:hypothetical protein